MASLEVGSVKVALFGPAHQPLSLHWGTLHDTPEGT